MTDNDLPLPVAAQKLLSFRTLPKGWHYGKGGPISDDMFKRSVEMYRSMILAGFTTNDAFPAADGEVQITGYHRGGQFVSITLELDGTYTLVHEVNDVECCSAERVTWSDAMRALKKIRGEVWSTSDSSIQYSGTPSASGSATWRLSTPVTQGSRWFAKPVQKPLVAA